MVAAPSTPELLATLLFALAVVHTFCTRFFNHLAHQSPRHAGLWHLLGEVEVVFGLWALVLVLGLWALGGVGDGVAYLEGRNFTEPLFVFAIMVVAASKPILAGVGQIIAGVSGLLPGQRDRISFFLCLALVPLLGSLITEPAAMTLAALLLRDRFFGPGRLGVGQQYATLGVLFVNISIGGTLTHFAAPPVLMVAAAWGWDSAYMFGHFGWKAAIAVVINALALSLWCRAALAEEGRPANEGAEAGDPMPWAMTLAHGLFLTGIVVFAHHPPVFLGIFLFFLGFTEAYPRHQNPLLLREGLLVAFFLAGLVVLGGLQQWWLQTTLSGVASGPLFFLSVALTALTDNAALTYLGSLVEGSSSDFRYALVAGAVTGGGLTVIANAPNPAGIALLKPYFPEAAISPLRLLAAALAPTMVAVLAFLAL